MRIAASLLTALALLNLSRAECAEPNQKFFLREDIRFGVGLYDLVRTTEALPQTKRYFQLLPAQREVIRAWYVGMKVSDDPPYPESGLAFLLETLQVHARNRGVQGIVAIEISVNESGKAEAVLVIEAPSSEMARAAVFAAKRTQFSPGLCGAKPCAMPFPVALVLRGK